MRKYFLPCERGHVARIECCLPLDPLAARCYFDPTMNKYAAFTFLLISAGCFGPPGPLPLTPAEKCAENGLILTSTKGAAASGVVGKVFAGSGKTESCGRPQTQFEVCEVEGNRRSALVKQTHPGTAETKIAAADAYAATRDQCMAANPPTDG